MRLSHKIGKILNGKALRSARRHTRAFLRNRRFPARLTTAAIIASIDPTAFEQIRKKYAIEDAGDAPPKYLDLETWISINLHRVRELELDYYAPAEILDIGCGAGYFLHISRMLGHNVLGLDVDESPMFRELTELLRIPRVLARIRPYQPLPEFDRKFDVITAHLVCFNNHKSDKLWGPDEWDYFLTDLGTRLKPHGRVWFELNREYDGTYYTPELEQYFRHRGAYVEGYRVAFNSGTLLPAAAAPVLS